MRSRGAFTLLELLVTLSLTVTAAAVAGHLFFGSMKSMASTASAANAQIAAEHCDDVLRRDVWSASRISVASPQACDFETGEGAIKWTIADDVFVRSAGTSTSRWPAAGARFESAALGITLVDETGKPLRYLISPESSFGAVR